MHEASVLFSCSLIFRNSGTSITTVPDPDLAKSNGRADCAAIF